MNNEGTMSQKNDHKDFYLEVDPKVLKERLTFAPSNAPWPVKMFIKKVEGSLGINYFRDLYINLRSRNLTTKEFWTTLIKELNINLDLTEEDINRIPKTGATIIVANHPFGGAEGTLLIELLNRIRDDYKILVTETLYKAPEIQPYTFYLKIQGEKGAQSHNRETINKAKDLLNNGGMVVIFPSGEVSSASLTNFKAVDPKWRSTPGWLVKETQANVLPMYFEGQNSWLFQAASIIGKPLKLGVLRLALLPKELANMRNKTIKTKIGKLISNKTLKEFGSPRNMTQYMRARTYLLGGEDPFQPSNIKSAVKKRTSKKPSERKMQKIIDPIPADQVLATINAGLESQTIRSLCTKESFEAFIVNGKDIPPFILQELGRLREVTFREVKEGSGQSLDIDVYDKHYFHLFIWDHEAKVITGAYRMGDIAQIFKQFGMDGIYCHSLFHFNESFIDKLGEKNCLEMGRSFVTPEYQRSPVLNVMWSAIAEFLLQNPQYQFFFGPVSISDAYKPLSKELLLDFLDKNFGAEASIKDMVLPFNQFKTSLKIDPEVKKNLNKLKMQEFDQIIEELEGEGKKIPPLMKYYTKILGAKFLSFSVDKEFNSVDGLIIVDISKISKRVIRSFLGSKEKEIEFFEKRNRFYDEQTQGKD